MSSISPRTPQNHPGATGTGSYQLRPQRSAAPEMTPKARSLVAGTVAAPANPVAQPPAPSNGALAFYRHPADRNQAATAILAGRTLDVRG